MTNEEAIAIMQNEQPRAKNPVYFSESDRYEAYQMAIEALKDRPTGWIPCSERLPEENGQYLITVKYEHEADYEDIYAEHGDWSDGKWDMFCFGHCGKVESIIAWMPLPEPWKEG